MTDRELLERAARAAGYGKGNYEDGSWLEIRYGYTVALYLGCDEVDGYWNPLQDDGQAMRLAVVLGMMVIVTSTGAVVHFDKEVEGETYQHSVDEVFIAHDGDRFATTRRAIARAAAEMETA